MHDLARGILVRFFQIPYFLIILGGALFVCVFIDYFQNKDLTKKEKTTTLTIFIVYVIYSVLSGLLVSPKISYHIEQSVTMIEYSLMFFTVVYYARKNNSIDILILNYALMYFLICVIFFIKPVLYNDDDFINRLTYAAGMNPNNFGMDMVMGTLCLFYFIRTKGFPSFFILLSMIPFSYSIVLSGSRKGFLGQAICISMIIVYLLPQWP